MIFLVFNLLLFVGSAVLIFSGFSHFQLFLDLPLGLEVLILIGFVTPVMNLYDTIKNFNEIILSKKSEGEDED